MAKGSGGGAGRERLMLTGIAKGSGGGSGRARITRRLILKGVGGAGVSARAMKGRARNEAANMRVAQGEGLPERLRGAEESRDLMIMAPRWRGISSPL
jgi:hypothetical protein